MPHYYVEPSSDESTYIFFSAIKFEININFNISDSEKFNIPIFLRKLEKDNDENSDEIKFESLIPFDREEIWGLGADCNGRSGPPKRTPFKGGERLFPRVRQEWRR